MIISGDKKFIAAPFDNENEIEKVVLDYSEFIFGPETIMLPKSLIKSADGSGTIPDGYVIDFGSYCWFIVEAELGSHSVWGHIAPQVSKQVVAAIQPTSRRLIVDSAIDMIRDSKPLGNLIDGLGIQLIDVGRVLGEIIESPPIIAIPIDEASQDLEEWAQTLKNEVRLWTVRKLVDLEDANSIIYEIPDEYHPMLDIKESGEIRGKGLYNISLLDLLDNKLLEAGMELSMEYAPRGGVRKTYTAKVTEDGYLSADGRRLSASNAALYFINQAGSLRKSVNGWTSWKTRDGRSLDGLRDFLIGMGSEQ